MKAGRSARGALIAGWLAAAAALAAPALAQEGGSPASAPQAASSTPASPAASVPDVVRRGQERLDKGDWNGALLILKSGLPAGENDPALQSALARAYSEIGEDAPEGSAAQQAIFQQALDHAQKELALAPNSAQAHLDVAITTGKMARVSGAKTKLKLAPVVADEARKTIAIDSNNWQAYHVLGVWNREIATLGGFKKFGASLMGGLPKASLDDAIANLETARRLAPTSIRNHLELARTYEKAHRLDDARSEYRQALSQPPAEPGDGELQRQARAELAGLS
jgi:tetratricopeptide (TPR) repeat protein